MSDAAGENVVLEIGAVGRRAASGSSQGKVAHAQAIVICGLGVALSWTNGKKEGAIRGESRQESLALAVFFTASVVKAFGLLWALFFAVRTLWKGDNECGGGGPPVLMIWGAKAFGEDPAKQARVLSGFGFQAIGIWSIVWNFFVGSHFGASIGSYTVVVAVSLFWFLYVAPTIRYFQELLSDPAQSCPIQCWPTEKRQIPARALSSVLALLVVTGPVVLYTLESVFIYDSESTEPAAYILAVLDLTTVVLALPFVGSFVACVVPRLWGGERALVSGPFGFQMQNNRQ